MTVFLLHIYNHNGISLYEKEWCRRKKSNLPKEQENKLMFGMLHSIKSFVAKMSPKDSKEGFMCYSTSRYKLHFYEAPTGLKFVMMTDVNVGNIRETLKRIYSSVYVEYVVKNAICGLNEPIESNLFESKLDAFVQGLSFFEEIKE
uniref:trafficking protein particle complex subunit 1 n=1 Tax=Ciona intestinalis TaxID=7719 RepID=UPI0000524477|nr:trafficking protein particle complex subunit 1 [Ciona intestinalis]|eukprot:XP_009861434.1 trafficking protein particle complex subunit 1 [Ciona intestinalis]